MQDTTSYNIGVVGTVESSTSRVVGSSLLAEQLNVLLGGVAELLDFLGRLLRTVGKLLGLVLDLLVQSLEDGDDGALDALLGLGVGVDHGLGVGAHVLEEAGDAAEALVKMVALLKGVGNGLHYEQVSRGYFGVSGQVGKYLQSFLILLGLVTVDGDHGAHVLLEVHNRMFPGLQSLRKKTSSLW